MKIYIDFDKLQITKIVQDVMYKGDVLSNAFELLFYNCSDTSWYPTMSQLAPNDRQAGDFAADALEEGESQTVIEDDITYLRYKFTIGAGWVLVRGKSEFFIWKNTVTPMTRKCIGKVVVTLNESTETYFIDDVEFNPKIRTYINGLASDIEDELNDKVDAQNATIASLSQASPSVFDTAANIQLLQENKGVAVATDTGYIWYWDTTITPNAYVSSGLQYNAPQIDNGSITPNKLDRIYVEGVAGKNKFDYRKLVNGYYQDTDGVFHTSNSWHYLRINVADFKSNIITLSGNLKWMKVAFFDSNNDFISGWSGPSSENQTKTFILSDLLRMPSYFYTSIQSVNAGTTIQIEDGNVATTYERYTGVLGDKQVIEENTSFMDEKINITRNILLPINVSNNYVDTTVNNDGSITMILSGDAQTGKFSPYFSEFYLESGKNYTLSSIVENDEGIDYGGIWIYPDIYHTGNRVASISIGRTDNTKTFSVETSGTYYAFIIIAANVNKTIIARIQLEDGITATDFVKAFPPKYVNSSLKIYIEDNYVKKEDIIKNDSIFTYRYLVPTFYNTHSNGLILLGTNDLRTFDLVEKRGLYTTVNKFNNNQNTNTLRDPAIIKIKDYYYFVYSIMGFVYGDNVIGMCRTKDFVTFEELDNLTVDDPTATNVYTAIWAPDWFRDGKNIYISNTCRLANGEFETVVYKYNPSTHTLSDGFKVNGISGIDGHIYKYDGYYYYAISGFNLYKSATLNGTYSRVNTNINYPNCEASFIVKKDDGTYRFYAQQLSAHYGTAHIVYCDSLTNSLEGQWSAVKEVNYTDEALEYAREIHNSETLDDEYWHWTIFDFNNSNGNNNNFVD